MEDTPAGSVRERPIGQMVEEFRELQKVMSVDEPVVGVRNVRRGGVWLRTTDCDQEHPEERLAGVGQDEGQGKSYGILVHSEWHRLRERDEGVKMGWIIRDDSIVPSTMTVGPEDPEPRIPNAFLDSDIEEVLLSGDLFTEWLEKVDSIVTIERALEVAEELKQDATSVYPRMEDLDLRLLVLYALEERMPEEMANPHVTMETMRGVAEREKIEILRDEQRSKKLLLRRICRHYVGENS